jgi:hypothetical protein
MLKEFSFCVFLIDLYQENNAFFIATHQTITYDQTQGVCPTVR